MKTRINLIRGIAGSVVLMLVILVFGCAQPMEIEKKPIEGAWKMIHLKFVSDGEVTAEFPAEASGEQVKIWTGSNFAFVGQFKMDSAVLNNYGSGTYTLGGTHYMEHIHLQNGAMADTMLMMFVEIRNDTLIQTWPADASGNYDEDNVNVETYIRLD